MLCFCLVLITTPRAFTLRLASSCHSIPACCSMSQHFIDTPSAVFPAHSAETARSCQLLSQHSCTFWPFLGSCLLWTQLTASRDLGAWHGTETEAKFTSVFFYKFRGLPIPNVEVFCSLNMPPLHPASYLLKRAYGNNTGGQIGEAFSEALSISVESVCC